MDNLFSVSFTLVERLFLCACLALIAVFIVRFFVDHIKLDRFRAGLKPGDSCKLYIGGGEYSDATIIEILQAGDVCVSGQDGPMVVSINRIYPII